MVQADRRTHFGIPITAGSGKLHIMAKTVRIQKLVEIALHSITVF